MNFSSSTIKEYADTLVNGLAPLAQKLQMPVETLWGWALKNNYAIVAEGIAACIVCATLFVPYVMFLKWGNKKGFMNFDTPLPLLVAVLGGFFLGAFLLISMTNFITISIPRLISPEWNTLQDIIAMIKGD